MFAELLKDCGSEAEMHWGREEDIDDDEEEEEEGNRHMEEEVGLQELCTLLGQPGAQRWALTFIQHIVPPEQGAVNPQCKFSGLHQLAQERALTERHA